jgi:hypothetical protein
VLKKHSRLPKKQNQTSFFCKKVMTSMMIDQWGSTDSPADINGDGIVNVTDLLAVVGAWGPCE